MECISFEVSRGRVVVIMMTVIIKRNDRQTYKGFEAVHFLDVNGMLLVVLKGCVML